MKITLTGALSHINQITISALVAASHQVQAITHSEDRVAAIKKLGATALVGSIDVIQAFKGKDAVYLMLTGMGQPVATRWRWGRFRFQ